MDSLLQVLLQVYGLPVACSPAPHDVPVLLVVVEHRAGPTHTGVFVWPRVSLATQDESVDDYVCLRVLDLCVP